MYIVNEEKKHLTTIVTLLTAIVTSLTTVVTSLTIVVITRITIAFVEQQHYAVTSFINSSTVWTTSFFPDFLPTIAAIIFLHGQRSLQAFEEYPGK